MYAGESICKESFNLWNILKQEVIEGTDPELESLALTAISSLIQCLEKGPVSISTKDSLNKIMASSSSGNLLESVFVDQF